MRHRLPHEACDEHRDVSRTQGLLKSSRRREAPCLVLRNQSHQQSSRFSIFSAVRFESFTSHGQIDDRQNPKIPHDTRTTELSCPVDGLLCEASCGKSYCRHGGSRLPPSRAELAVHELRRSAGTLGDAVRGAKAMGWAGLNCSIPNEIAVIQYLGGLGESAQIIGA